jgi:hypothetical protein
VLDNRFCNWLSALGGRRTNYSLDEDDEEKNLRVNRDSVSLDEDDDSDDDDDDDDDDSDEESDDDSD